MSVLIVSDIHGSAFYCEKMVSVFHKTGADRIFLLGDVLYHGPRNALPKDYSPMKVVELLTPLSSRITAVKGNCDAEIDDMVLPFDLLTPEKMEKAGNRSVLLTHGHRFSFASPPDEATLKETDIVFSGHTHVPFCGKIGNTLFFNPGSISIPKENSRHSTALLDGDRIMRIDADGAVYETIEL